MTLHVIRGALGLLRETYVFHANVVTSSDMAMFLAVQAGDYRTAIRVQDTKREWMNSKWRWFLSMIGLMGLAEKIFKAYLLEAWSDYFKFHLGVTEALRFEISVDRYRFVDCIHDKSVKPRERVRERIR